MTGWDDWDLLLFILPLVIIFIKNRLPICYLGPAEAVHLWGGDDPAVPVPGRQAEAAQL